MFKLVIVFSMILVCCYCLESTDMIQEESRAKRKRNPIRLIAMILLFVISKVAIFKIASFFMLMAVFQKLFYAAGLVLSYFMKTQAVSHHVPVVTQAVQPQPTYGLPQDYNTVGYSYGPPDREPFGPDGSLPSVAEFGNTFNGWFKNKK